MSRERLLGGIGATLQEARKRRGVSLCQVADSTKIAVSILKGLECNDISRLPGGVLGRGFVRSFAAAVGLDPEATVTEFVAQFPQGSVTDGYPAARRIVDENDVSDARSEVLSKIGRWEGSTLLRFVAIGVLAAAVVACAGMMKRWPQWLAAQSRTATAQAGQADAVVRLDVPNENGLRVAGSDISLQTQRSGEPHVPSVATDPPVSVNAVAGLDSVLAVPAGGNSTPVAASSIPTADSTDHSSPTNAESADANGGDRPDEGALGGDRLSVVLSVTSPSWVIATVDGEQILNRLLQVGEQEMLEAHRGLVLTMGDAGAIVMTVNGALAKSLGRPGETITARLSRTNFRHFLRR